MRPTYSTTSPDYVTSNPRLGVEARVREVPVPRAVVEGLRMSLAFVEFRHLTVVITGVSIV
jgi:hypothetical protein